VLADSAIAGAIGVGDTIVGGPCREGAMLFWC